MNPAAPVLTGTTYRDAFAQTVDYAARSAVYFGARTAVVDVDRALSTINCAEVPTV